MENEELMIDIRNNLAYISPMDDSRIQVKPSITDQFFDRRELYNGFYVPSPCDELTHILCHCIFDKKGTFSEYYIDRCNELTKTVINDSEQHKQFKSLLSEVFFDADQLVYDMALEKEYNNILSELYQYDEY